MPSLVLNRLQNQAGHGLVKDEGFSVPAYTPSQGIN